MSAAYPTPLPLALHKQKSILDDLTLLEKFSRKDALALLKSPHLLQHWEQRNENDTWGEKIHFKNEEEQILRFCDGYKLKSGKVVHKKYNEKLGGVLVTYTKPKHGWGRSFPNYNLGSSSIRRPVRNTLFGNLYLDFDLKNMQPECIRNLCESQQPPIPCPIISLYCAERDRILAEISTTYGIDKDIAKKLVIRFCFFGTFYGFCKENNLVGLKQTDFLVSLEREVKDIAYYIRTQNPELYQTAKDKEKENTKLMEKEKRERQIMGSFFGLYLQEYECRIVEQVVSYLIHQTDLLAVEGTESRCFIYEYDGIKLLAENVADNQESIEDGIARVLEMLDRITPELTGFHLKWANKPMTEKYDISEYLPLVEEMAKPNVQFAELTAKIYNIIEEADVGAVSIIKEMADGHFIYSLTDKKWYCWNGKRWELGDRALRHTIMYQIDKYMLGLLEPFSEYDLGDDDLEDDGGKEDEATEDDGISANEMRYRKVKKAMKNYIKRTFKQARGIDNVVSVAKTLFADSKLEFDTNPYLFGCDNGVIDFERECFRPYHFSDRVTLSCGWDFRPVHLPKFQTYIVYEEQENEDGSKIMVEKILEEPHSVVCEEDMTQEDEERMTLLLTVLHQIFPNPEVFVYVMFILCTALSGLPIKKFFVFNGDGNNAKGFLNVLMKMVIGQKNDDGTGGYFYFLNPTVWIEDDKRMTSGGANPEIAKISRARYVVSQELPVDKKLNNKTVKLLTGGDGVKARLLNSNDSTVHMNATFVIEVNKKPNFREDPMSADEHRIDDIGFESEFTVEEKDWDETRRKIWEEKEQNKEAKPFVPRYKFPLNVTYATDHWRHQHKNAMLNILVERLLQLKRIDYNINSIKPECIKMRTEVYLQQSLQIHLIFTKIFELKQEGKVYEHDGDYTLADIAAKIRTSNYFTQELTRDKQNEYTRDYIKNFFGTNKFYKDSVYKHSRNKTIHLRGWRLKPFGDDSAVDSVDDSLDVFVDDEEH